MNKPVFTEKQMKGTIRGKKGNKETLKNVLVNPYTHYWPLVKDKNEIVIREILQKELPMMRAPKVPVPWKELQAVPKEQRKEYRMKQASTKFEPPNETTRSSLIFGVNEVTRLLEQDNASSVLVTGDVSPQLMVKHVIDLAVLRKVPILIVSGLRDLLKTCTGIGSATIALTKHLQAEDSALSRINKAITNIHKNYPAPVNLVNYNHDKEMFFDEREAKSKETRQADALDIDEKCFEDCYLYRKSKSERVFVPSETTKRDLKSSAVEYIKLGYEISLNEVKSSYKPLIVNRIRGNKNRSQKKIAMLKKKNAVLKKKIKK